jgi:hypothetical protein
MKYALLVLLKSKRIVSLRISMARGSAAKWDIAEQGHRLALGVVFICERPRVPRGLHIVRASTMTPDGKGSRRYTLFAAFNVLGEGVLYVAVGLC